MRLTTEQQKILFEVVDAVRHSYLTRFKQYYLDWEDVEQQLYVYALEFFSRQKEKKVEPDKLPKLLYRYLRWRIRRYILRELRYRFTEIPNNDIGGYFDATSEVNPSLFNDLDEIQKRAIILRYYHGYTIKEIARILLCSPRRVERILSEIRRKLQEAFF